MWTVRLFRKVNCLVYQWNIDKNNYLHGAYDICRFLNCCSKWNPDSLLDPMPSFPTVFYWIPKGAQGRSPMNIEKNRRNAKLTFHIVFSVPLKESLPLTKLPIPCPPPHSNLLGLYLAAPAYSAHTYSLPTCLLLLGTCSESRQIGFRV